MNLQISVMFCMAFSELSPFLGYKLKAVLSADVNAAMLFHVVPLTCQCCFMILMFFLHFSVEELLEISLSPGKQPCCSISHPACSILEHSRTAFVSCISRNIMAIHLFLKSEKVNEYMNSVILSIQFRSDLMENNVYM